MINQAKKLHEELLNKLQKLKESKLSETSVSAQRIGMIVQTIGELKENIRCHVFSEEDEMVFYKSVFPIFLSLLMYESEKVKIESAGMVGTPGSRSEAIYHLHKKIDGFFDEQAEFFRYYRMGNTVFDRYYFVRGALPPDHCIELLPSIVDQECCTIHSYRVAAILAYVKLMQEIRDDEKKDPQVLVPDGGIRKIRLRWTATKAALTELTYALDAAGVFNDGNATLADTVRYLEEIFDIELGNTSRTFQEILARSKGRTAFLDRLAKGMLGRIDEIEGDE